jgi:hypothetical protein
MEQDGFGHPKERSMMNRRKMLTTGFSVVICLAAGRLAWSAGDARVRLRGTIESVVGDQLRLTLRNKKLAEVTLPQSVRITWLLTAPLGDIQPGSYVGTAAIAQADGTLKAMEVQVFPPSMRGVGEGTHPWDMGPQSSMTNGTVGSLVNANGRTMTITYKGGEKRVVVPDGVPIVTYQPADRAALTAGAHVLVNGTRAADGSVIANYISVGKDGLVPPM